MTQRTRKEGNQRHCLSELLWSIEYIELVAEESEGEGDGVNGKGGACVIEINDGESSESNLIKMLE